MSYGATSPEALLNHRIQQLFLKNGYRAVQYQLQHYGCTDALAVYDSSVISITKINRSPEADTAGMLLYC